MLAVNKIITEPYKGTKKIESRVSSGFASIKQKSTLVGLKVLSDGRFTLGSLSLDVKKGQIAYFKEDVLCSQDWPTKVFTCQSEQLKEGFILAEPSHLVMLSDG